jgi:hypothetical protein
VRRGGDGPAGQRVARRACGAGAGDAVGDAGQRLRCDGDRQVTGSGDLGLLDPGLDGERFRQGARDRARIGAE